MRPARAYFPFLLAILSGALLALSFPRWDLNLLAWVALIPLFFAVDAQSNRRSFLLGWVTGMVYFGGTLSWVTISMTQYGKVPWAVSYLLMLALVAYLALYPAFFAIGIRGTSRRSFLFIAPVLWTALEYVRGHLLTGFPWSDFGYSQYRSLPVIQIADFSSVYGVGFLLILVNTALFRLIEIGWKERRVAWRDGMVGFSVLAFALLYGLFRLGQPMEKESSVTVAVVQGNIEQDRKWDTQFRDETMRIYRRLSLEAVQQAPAPPQLVIWPESAAPFFFQSEPVYRRTLLDLARDGNFYLLFGSPAYEPAGSGQIALLNSSFLLSPGEEAISRYDKLHLVPFGEYVPLSSLLFFVNKMAEGIGEFVPGKKAVVMQTPFATIGTVICFEVIFPEVVRRFVKNGATVMTTITNDAWFGDSAAPYQHFSMVVFRSIENRVPFARAANTGISGFIDPYGRVKKRSPLFVETALTETLRPGGRRTFYTLYGDIFAIACVIIALGWTTFILIKRRMPHAD